MGDQFVLEARRQSTDAVRSYTARNAARSTRQSRRARAQRLGATVQPRLLVGPADDPFEREAERAADAALAGPASTGHHIGVAPVARGLLRFAQRAIGKAESPSKKDDEKYEHAQKSPAAATGPDVVPAAIESGVTSISAGGRSLPLRTFFESRFGFDFADVRVHSGPEAAGAASALGARAFTVGDHIYFGTGQLQPSTHTGRHLIAHELTHTIQQKGPAARAARLMPAPPRVQRFPGIPDDLGEQIRSFVIKDFPPWDLITLIVGYDPIREVAVKGSFRDWLRAALKIIPNGEALFDRLDREGKIEAVHKWWAAEVAALNLSVATITGLIKRGWDAVSGWDMLDPVKAWNDKIKPVVTPTVNRVREFVKAVGSKVFEVVKDIVLAQIGGWAKSQKGYPLLTTALGRDPVTGEAVTPTLEGVIFAVLDLVDGGDKVKENLKKSKTVEKAATWFKAEVKTLDLTFDGIRLLFSQAWNSFAVTDLLNPALLVEKMWGIFGPPVTRLIKFLGAVGMKVLEFIFEGAMIIAGPIGPRIVGIIRKIGTTFRTIVNDPIAFLGHLVSAMKQGVQQFAKNIWEHLKTGVLAWLTGALEGAGVVLPKVWDMRGILDLALQILGITYPKVRVKLVKVLGEKTVSMLEKGFGFLRTLLAEGPAAAWKEIVAAIGSLWDLVIGGIKDWAVTKIVTAAITKLVSMLNPAGAVVQAIVATYNTVAFFIERINQILDFVQAVVDSIAGIAAGKIAHAANWIEKAMAKSIPVLLGFLARLVGLGDVSDRIKKIITGIHVRVDKGIDKAIAFVVTKARALFGIRKAESKKGEVSDAKAAKGVTMANESHTVTIISHGRDIQVTISSGVEKRLDDAATDAYKATEKSNRPHANELLKVLSNIIESAKEKQIWYDWEAAGRPGITGRPGIDFQVFLERHVDRLLTQLAALGKLGHDSLDSLVFTDVPGLRQLPHEYQREWIRYNLYFENATEEKDKHEEVTKRDLTEIRRQVREANKNHDTEAFKRLKGTGSIGKKIPEWAEPGVFKDTDVGTTVRMSVDHPEEIFNHWNKTGRNTPDGPRRDIAVGQDLELVTVRYNSSKKGPGGFEKVVNESFESRMAESGRLGRKIKGRFFMRQDGTPLV